MRLISTDLLRGVLKVLRNRDTVPSKPDHLSRAALIVIPIGVAVLVTIADITVSSSGAILTCLALLAGGFLTSFTHLSTLRLRLTERRDLHEEDEAGTRDLLDEVATLLLAATAMAVFTAATTAATMIAFETTSLSSWPAATVCGLGSMVVLLFALTVPRLYNAYVDINSVRTALNGADRRDRN